MRFMDSNETIPMEPEKTKPVDVDQPVEQGTIDEAPQPKKGRKIFIIGLSIFFLLTIISGAVIGYFVGTRQGDQDREQAVIQVADEQFRLALEDLDAGRYEIARQRLEYISRIDPSYPGVAEKLAVALLVLNAPTATPIVLATPTPNLAPVTELFEQAEAAFAEENWTLAIDTLLALRAKDVSFRAIEVDSLMFASLRNRGVHRISAEGLLEEGIYDLSRAELFGPLDRDANNWRSWAELYLVANSYMGLDWGKAAFHFAQLYLIAPYLKNDTYIKYAISTRGYGDFLMSEDDPCGAVDQYHESLEVWDNPELQPTATKAAKACMTATAFVPPPPPPEETPTPEETPLTEETPTPTITPTETSENGGS